MPAVLIVDDDPIAIEILQDHLAEEGYVVRAAADWTQMNQVLFGEQIAVLVLDIKLPGLEGDVLAEIVQRKMETPPKIILHSSIPETDLRRKMYEVGAANYLTKGSPGYAVRKVIESAARAFAEEFGSGETDPGPPPGVVNRRPVRRRGGEALPPPLRRDREPNGDG